MGMFFGQTTLASALRLEKKNTSDAHPSVVVFEISAGRFLVGDAEHVGADEDGRDKDAVALERVLECGQDLHGAGDQREQHAHRKKDG
jgi:hypothetical protein